ncbi:MAG: type III-B CRISPR module-associated protein Cmr5 [Firmicutes bacterium]|nr:type III-B CRISPR module-associated protein Cmr5 [Bacillota bacterium]
MRQLLEQERAQYALRCIDRLRQDPTKAAKYKIYVHELPAMVQMNGLGQALAQIMSDYRKDKDGPAARQLMADLQQWLVDERRLYRLSQGQDVLGALMSGDRASYMRAYEEIIRLCNWLKKLADAYIEGPASA